MKILISFQKCIVKVYMLRKTSGSSGARSNFFKNKYAHAMDWA